MGDSYKILSKSVASKVIVVAAKFMSSLLFHIGQSRVVSSFFCPGRRAPGKKTLIKGPNWAPSSSRRPNPHTVQSYFQPLSPVDCPGKIRNTQN